MGVFFLLKKQLLFYKRDRLSIALFLIAFTGLLWLIHGGEKPEFIPVDLNTSVSQKERALLDSLKLHKAKPRRYKFNPNFMSPYNAYLWGISDSALTALESFRAQDKWLRSAADFQRVTGISDSLLAEMKSYFRFPAWTQQSRPNTLRDRPEKVKELNAASQEELEAVYGIGPVLAGRILRFKERYGPYSDSLQLRLIYGLKPKVRAELLKHFTVTTKDSIQKIDFNTAAASDLATLPGINFELAKELVIFRRLRDGISAPEDLLMLEGVTADWLAGIAVYLQFE